ncbi:MAG: outer membrane protein assembly factor BamA [Candidatus Muproteobacteria bacterium RBG_19FT_COMBO_61_10]|uniref:Outer membrane protein assembly factor BamA n=1 Tax=Candidatus Muproteobacteria bacterium RBG_19FT_COMBO_61_10 TaxID=1817761 RepID=A0A1F6UP64_9PROT|nr:MAG: outer membrane protein assembly factor BamA [Candidatus Muproteobacteria bacterium RBG_19FT_COMBO_61_10]
MLAFLLPASLAQAIENFLVKDIRVEGLQRIAPGTVFNYLPIKVGDSLSELNARAAIAALFKTGFFQDVRLERSGNVLIVHVTERPSVDSIKISGTKEIDEKTLLSSLKELGLAEGLVFNSSLLDKTEQELKRQYFSRGRYAVNIKTTVTPLERNRVGIHIDVAEGEVTKIHGITIVGNRIFKDSELLKTFSLSTSTLFSFYTKNDQYSKQQLAADLESLRNFYQNQGYLDFTIDSTQVSITPDKQDIYVTVNLTEGRKYTVTDVKLGGKLIFPEMELRKLISVKTGDVFSRQEITDSSKRINDRFGNDGYAFANVNAVPEINRENGTVAFTFFIDPGQRVYVRRVNFSGNLSTNDEVLRREMRQMEGAWFSTSKVQRSRVRLQRLGFFEDVNIETPPVTGSPDQVDINVSVKERLVNNFMFGVGYSDADGALINASMNFKNFLGTGKEVALSADNSSVNRHINLSYIDPYYTADGISRSISLYSTRTDTSAADTAAYIANTDGLGVGFGMPISEDHSLNFGLAYEKIDLFVPVTGSKVASDFVAENGAVSNVFKTTFGWARDTLDSPIFPNSGTQQRASAEVTLPGGDLEYFRLSYSASAYFPLTKSFTYKLKASLDYGDGYGDTLTLPFYKYFYAGGSNSVRGYRSRSLGPTDIGGPDPTLTIGGDRRVLVNTELLFPFPGMADNKAMRLSAFVDGGMVYGTGQDIDLGEMRYAAGAAFNWFSPIGPLSISYALPLNDQTGDRTESVQFTLGQSFR